MANTVMTAKNTFAEGLVMDFAPDNTQATTLTSALNATLLTFNGNEMSLQNDMGNGRVETAYLPEGYVPVGTCEFGDIIYIVSYNPIINKSQIGCFPSPERNISSDEIGGLGQSLKWTDFQGSDGSGPNGEIVASSVKKILYGTKDMTSGDKYIIYSAELDNAGNHEYLSDYGNTSHQHERFPKLVKIHVVSIEESGKITYLDSSTKWYKENDFYIQNSKKIVDKPDLDSYRTMVSSAYSIFSSKVSGKLALLVELEKITGFSCTWSAYTKEIDDNSDYQLNKYSIYWNFSWNTDDNNINPNAVVLTQSKWTGEDDTHSGKYQIWEKDDKGWALGGKNKNWVDGPSIPVAYPNPDYNYKTISRVYNPETYRGTFENFINSGSYNAQSKTKLDAVKQELGLSNTELIKANLSRNTEGTPDEGKYYFNCSSSSISKDGKVTYYTNYENELKAISPKAMSDDIINNTFNYPIVKHFADFLIPIKQKIVEGSIEEWKNLNINNLIYYYELTPSMPYGLLREFSQDGYIDFKKIGTKSIELNSWRYYNYENTSTLTWGLEAYTEPNKGISEVVFLFYDNQGLAAAYHNSGKISYNGKFTEYFTLNASGTNYKLNNKKLDGEVFYHKGEPVKKDNAIVSNTYLDDSGKVVDINSMQEGLTYYLNDAGTLYSNCLYLVKIVIKYCSIGTLDEYIEDESEYIKDYRWYWTNTMFNDYYQSVRDFQDLQFNLSLNVNHIYSQKNNFLVSTVEYKQTSSNLEDYAQLIANVDYVNQDRSADSSGNISMKLQGGLQNDYHTFNLSKEAIENIDVCIYLGNSYISQSVDQPTAIFTGQPVQVFPGIYPTNQETITPTSGYISEQPNIGKNLMQLLGLTGGGDLEIYSSETSYKNYKNSFSLEFSKSESVESGEVIEYINDQESDPISVTYPSVKKNLSQVELSSDDSINITFTGILFSKYYNKIKESAIQCRTLKPLLCHEKDLNKYNMFFYDGHLYFKNVGGVAVGDDGDGGDRTRTFIFQTQSNNMGEILQNFSLLGRHKTGKNSVSFLSDEMQSALGTPLSRIFPGITPFFIVRHDNYGKKYKINNGSDDSNTALVYPSYTYRQYFDYKSEYEGGFYSDFGNINGDNSYVVLGLSDTNSKLHLINCFIPVSYGSEKISQIVRYKNSAPYKNLRTVGDMVGSVLMNLYYKDDLIQTHLYPKIVNFISLKNYDIYFTRDIISKLKVNDELSDSNSLLLIRGMPYDKYLAELSKQIEHSKEVKRNNVDVQVNGIIKNSPLSMRFSYNYKEQQDTIDPQYVVLCSNGDILFKNTGFSSERMYYRIVGTDDFAVVGSRFSYHPLLNIKYENSRYIGTYDKDQVYNNSYIYNNFLIYEDTILCSNSSSSVSEYNTFTINGYEDGWSGIYPLNKKEVLVANAQFG